MKAWPTDHPKAKLMIRKRAAIVDAARKAFMREGYDGASMEAIAADAGVSIATLYRHAEGKDDLFAAVIAIACHPGDRDEQTRIEASLKRSLADVMTFIGVMFQERLASDTTVALFRTVMTETKRFPHLGEMAYRGLVGAHEDALEEFLATRTETAGLDPVMRRRLGTAFLGRLAGTETLRVLLGLNPASTEERLERAHAATAEFIAALPSAP